MEIGFLILGILLVAAVAVIAHADFKSYVCLIIGVSLVATSTASLTSKTGPVPNNTQGVRDCAKAGVSYQTKATIPDKDGFVVLLRAVDDGSFKTCRLKDALPSHFIVLENGKVMEIP
jgi:hypothetical protein